MCCACIYVCVCTCTCVQACMYGSVHRETRKAVSHPPAVLVGQLVSGDSLFLSAGTAGRPSNHPDC